MSVETPLDHAMALWPGLEEGRPQGCKSVWPAAWNKDGRLPDELLYVRSMDSIEQRADLQCTVNYLASLAGEADRYISLNTFRGRRCHEKLHSLTGLVIDLDLVKVPQYGSDFMAMRQDALDAISGAGIPLPNLAVHTGRGVHFYWLFDRLVPAAATPRWLACLRHLIALLGPFGADPAVRDTARVLRLVGTVNTKARWTDSSGDEHLWRVSCEVLQTARHNFDFLADQILPVTRSELDIARAKRAGSGKDIGSVSAPTDQRRSTSAVVTPIRRPGRQYAATAAARQQDLDLLASTLYPGGIPEGSRDKYLFHVACNLAWTCAEPTLVTEVLAWRQKHVPTWSDREALSSMGTVLRRAKEASKLKAAGAKCSVFDDERYTVSSERLWQEFGLDVERAGLQAQMLAILPSGVKQERQKARRKALQRAKHADHYTGHGIRAANVPRALQARALRETGQTLREIAEALATTPKTISAWLDLPDEALRPLVATDAAPSPAPSYPQPGARGCVLPKKSLNNGVACGPHEGRSLTGPGGMGHFLNAGSSSKAVGLLRAAAEALKDGLANSEGATCDTDRSALGEARKPGPARPPGSGSSSERTQTPDRKDVVGKTVASPSVDAPSPALLTNSVSGSKHRSLSRRDAPGTDLRQVEEAVPMAATAKKRKFDSTQIESMRKMPVVEALQRLGVYFKEDASYVPKSDPDTRRVHISLDSGQVVELIHTGRKWFLKSRNVGGGSSIDLVMLLLEIGFNEAVKRLLASSTE